jgi:hypothetical protein
VATVYHRYLRRGEQPEPEPARDLDADAAKAAKAAADLKFVHEKRLQVIARRRETEIRNASRKRELVCLCSSKLRFSSSRCASACWRSLRSTRASC